MANLKNVTKKTKAQAMGMHSEVLTGRTQQKFFNPDEAEIFITLELMMSILIKEQILM